MGSPFNLKIIKKCLPKSLERGTLLVVCTSSLVMIKE